MLTYQPIYGVSQCRLNLRGVCAVYDLPEFDRFLELQPFQIFLPYK